MQASPNPTGFAETTLSAVSCPSSKACIAIGTLNGYEAELTETWNGTRWTLSRTPNPTGTPFYTIRALSCASATACIAVGEAGKTAADTDTRTLAERWDGSTWTVQSTPSTPGTGQSALNGVSCTSPTACTAVGYYVSGTGGGAAKTLAEDWNGTSWTIRSTPDAPGTTDSWLYGVSCASVTACTAVGYSETGPVGGGEAKTLAEDWNGTSWTIRSTPDVPEAGLNGVSCTSVTACTAVGYSDSGLLAERWDGTSWSVQSIPSPVAASSTLSAVSCSSATACTAVGNSRVGGNYGDVPLAESWDGTSWAIQTTPNPPTTSSDGTSWSIQTTLNPAADTQSALSAVACSSMTACTAVGEFQPGPSTQMAFVERYS